MVATRPTGELAAIVLADSARLQEEEAEYANRKGFSKHRPALPLYTEADAEAAVRLIRSVEPGETVELTAGVRTVLNHAGHILGAATVTLSLPEATVLFSGDLGRPTHPILLAPDEPSDADVVVVESTYGDRRHEDEEAEIDELADAISATARRGGVVIVPAFAVDRTEVVLMTLKRLATEDRIPSLPVFVDSPMALAVLGVYRKAMAGGHNGTIGRDWRDDPFEQPGGLYEMPTPEDSKSLNAVREPAIIVSASGMATGGRVLHHLVQRLGDQRNLVVLTGYQAPGTRGRSLADGAEFVKMLGRYVPVRAQIVQCGGFSAHADSDELIGWLAKMARPPGIVYLVHGEPDSSELLRQRISSELGWFAVIPALNETVWLDRMP